MNVIDKIKLDGTTYDVGKTPDTTLGISGSPADAAKVGTELNKKVDKVTGKGLSTEDFTTVEKTKLAGIAEGATNIVIDPTLTQSGQAADAKMVGDALDSIKPVDSVPTQGSTNAVSSGGVWDEIRNIASATTLQEQSSVLFTIAEIGKSIRFSTGEEQKYSTTSITNYVPVSMYVELTYKRILSIQSAPTHGMAFYDADKVYISGQRSYTSTESVGYSDYTISVPENASYARFTVLNDEETYGVFTISGKTILKGMLDAYDERVDRVESLVSLEDNISIDFSILETGKSIQYSTGNTMSNSYSNTTDYIDISAFDALKYKRIKQVDSGTTGMAFYDVNKSYISGQRAGIGQEQAGYFDELAEIKIPANALYARFTIKKDTETYGEFYLSGTSKLNALLPKESIYRKNVLFATMSPEWYKGQGETYSDFTSNTTYEEVITAWDALVENSKGYVTKETIGASSDNKIMYCYKLIPLRYRNNTAGAITNNPPTFLIVASQHGFEKSAAYGTYYFARDLVYNFDKNPVLNSLRTKCAIYVVPVGNPYGFDNKTRKNANGVDLNRNWGPSDDDDPSSAYYGGAEPFDQPETQAMKSVIDGNPNLFFVVDYHTNGQYKADSWANVNWISYPYLADINDEYYNHAYIAGQFHISDLSENLPLEYDLDTNGESIGTATQGAPGFSRPTIGYYSRAQKNIMGFTFEGNNGLPSEESAYSSIEQKINSELIGNWIKNLYLAFQNA